MDKRAFSILYIDDEHHNLITFKAAFRREYRILTAQSGPEALEVLRNNEVGLVISDQRMPEMTGVEVLEKISREYPDTVRIILTGFSDVEAIINGINSGGIFRYITKPWEEQELRMTIENARQVHRLNRSNHRILSELQQKLEEQERLMRLFVRYVPEQVVTKALATTDMATMFEGEELNVAVLFCDLRGFTRMSEQLPPEIIVKFLNDYYSLMSMAIHHHHGSVTQFVGDEIFATFGAPVADVFNERNAVFCSLEMMDKLNQLNEQYASTLGSEICMGIGINAGPAITGNMGSEARINYAVTGETVNTGKRLEILSKEKDNSILISQAVYDKTKGIIKTQDWPRILMARGNEISVYQVLERK
ncbi:MAG: adenylate/guanylate cyclase domain-containing protein [Bacteroidota bacterium]